jgi:hypothetical protein
MFSEKPQPLIFQGLRLFGAPGMGDDLVVKVHYRLGSRNC